MNMIKEEFETPSDLETVAGYDIVDNKEKLYLPGIKPLDPNLHIRPSSLIEGHTASFIGFPAPDLSTVTVKLEIGNADEKGCSVTSLNASEPSTSISSPCVPERDKFKFSISNTSDSITDAQDESIIPARKLINNKNCLKKEPSSPTDSYPTLNEETIVIHSNTDDLVSGNTDLENDIAGKLLHSNNTPSTDSGCEPSEVLLAEQQSRSNKPTVEEKKISKITFGKLISDMSRSRQNKGNFACRICLKNYVLLSALKKHMFQKHPKSRDLRALVQKDNKDSDNASQFLWFCPRNCKYHTSVYKQLSKHLVKCQKPDLLPHLNRADNVEIGKNLGPLESDKAHDGDTSAGDLMVRTQQTGLALDYDTQTVDQDLHGIPLCQLCDSVFSTNLLLKAHLKDCHKQQDMRRTRAEETPFKCCHCDKSFSGRGALNVHVRKHTGEKPFKCSHCDKRFSQIGSLNVHMRLHTGEKPFSCYNCNKSFSHSGHANRHMRIHTGGKSFKSSYCKKSLSQSGDFHNDMRIHTAEKPFKCSHCNKSFSQKGCLHVHMRIHTGEKPFKCSHCHKSFRQRGNFHQHIMRIHTGEKPFKCSHCNKRFSSKDGLHVHIRIHTGEKPFKCSHCHKKFRQSGNFIKHMRIHTREKPFICSYCNKSFSSKDSLHVHVRIHTGEKPFKCRHCHKSFCQRGNFHKHMSIHTGEKPFKCSYCNKSFSQRDSLNLHIRIHTGERPFECSHCNTRFTRSSNLHKHMRLRTGEKPFECSYCNVSFSHSCGLDKHKTIHTGEKPFKCRHCNKSFSQIVSLHKHMDIHTSIKAIQM